MFCDTHFLFKFKTIVEDVQHKTIIISQNASRIKYFSTRFWLNTCLWFLSKWTLGFTHTHNVMRITHFKSIYYHLSISEVVLVLRITPQYQLYPFWNKIIVRLFILIRNDSLVSIYFCRFLSFDLNHYRFTTNQILCWILFHYEQHWYP